MRRDSSREPAKLPPAPKVPVNPYIQLLDFFWEACAQPSEAECVAALDRCHAALQSSLAHAETELGATVAELDRPVELKELPTALQIGLSTEPLLIEHSLEEGASSPRESDVSSLDEENEGRTGRRSMNRVSGLLTARGFGLGPVAELRFGDTRPRRRRRKPQAVSAGTAFPLFDAAKQTAAVQPFESDFAAARKQLGLHEFPQPYQMDYLYLAAQIRQNHPAPGSKPMQRNVIQSRPGSEFRTKRQEPPPWQYIRPNRPDLNEKRASDLHDHQ